MLEKIRYRLVYNRQKKLNKQGTALVQVEAYLNQRKAYFKTNVYLKPEHWSKQGAQVVNHPQSNELNAMLYGYILDLQAIIDFKDLNYTFLKDFDVFLRNKGLQINTIGKHMRVLRTLVNEAINQGYIPQDAYPFRKFKIKKEQTEHRFLLPNELEKMESLKLPEKKNNSQHVLDAFLFCCYTGLRFSDFKQLSNRNLIIIDGNSWLILNSLKTGSKLQIPLYLLFRGKALNIISHYNSIEELSKIGCNSDTNRILQKLVQMAGINKKITYHTARHTCATLLVHQGVPITTVQRILGHTSVRTTQIYSEVFAETLIKDLTLANEKSSLKNMEIVKRNRKKANNNTGKVPLAIE